MFIGLERWSNFGGPLAVSWGPVGGIWTSIGNQLDEEHVQDGLEQCIGDWLVITCQAQACVEAERQVCVGGGGGWTGRYTGLRLDQ